MKAKIEDKQSVRYNLIKQLLARIQAFGFVNVTEENIITDEVYKLYFEKMLIELKGQNIVTDDVINDLLKIIKKNKGGTA